MRIGPEYPSVDAFVRGSTKPLLNFVDPSAAYRRQRVGNTYCHWQAAPLPYACPVALTRYSGTERPVSALALAGRS